MPPTVKRWLGWLFAASVLGSCATIMVEDYTQSTEEEQLRHEFVRDHCKHEGYASGRYRPNRAYRCDDGNLYVWEDLPRCHHRSGELVCFARRRP